jgi:LacI family transcriptional regulator
VFNSTEYLISLGHRRIVFFSEVLRWPKTQEMVRGFHNALKKHELSFEDCPVEEETHAANSMDAENFHYVTLRLVRLIRDLSPTALLLSNDWLAFIFLKVLQDIGQDVPSDMAVMGYNDDPVSQLISPSLSTVSVHLEGMGREAGAALVSLLNSGERVTRIVQPQLVIRKSTAPPSRDRR